MIATLLRFALDVRVASHVGALLAGEPQMGPTVSCIAWRESRHELVSVHEGDAWMQRRLGEGLSTRGVHGQVAAFALPSWLHWAPWVLDVPLVSAVVATRRARSWQCRQTAACYSWTVCQAPRRSPQTCCRDSSSRPPGAGSGPAVTTAQGTVGRGKAGG